MDQQDRPTTRGGTSSGRPRTGRPGTSSARPTTSGGKRPATSNRPLTGNVDSQQYIEEEDYEGEYDDEDYESEDDGDVFAFLPPELGPSAVTVQLDGTGQEASAPPALPHTSLTAPTTMSGEEETFFYDEATGAVYDAQGVLVQSPVNVNLRTSQQPISQPTNVTLTPPAPTHINLAMPKAVMQQQHGYASSGSLQGGGSMPSLIRQDSTASSVNKPMLPHALGIAGFANGLENVPGSRGSGMSRVSSIRDVGITAGGGHQIDAMGRDVSNQLRKRTNRLSQSADTPVSELQMKYPNNYDEEFEYKHGIEMYANENGIVQPQLDFNSTIDGSSKRLRTVELELETEEDSPYPEVRASVSNIDDVDMPCGTVRAWFLAFVLSTLAGAANQVLNYRLPSPVLTPIVMQLITYPCGKFLASTLPIRTFYLPRMLGGGQFSLNPGLFNIKEHALITIVLNMAIGQAYALHAILAINSPFFYNSPKPILFSILFTISTQMIGFSLAGVSRRFLVWPASMIWPQNLVTTTILNTLHAEEDGHDGTMTRFRYFIFVLGAIFIWEFVPLFLFQALSTFGWLCWIWPDNFVVNTLFGTQTGLGLSVLTFDWNQVNYIGSPLVFPWWAECNTFAGFILWICILAPALYFSNTLYTAYMPFNASAAWDNTGSPYQIMRIISSDLKLDEAAYEAYSPVFLSASYQVLYITAFASATAILSHTALYHGKALWQGFRNAKTEEDDIHAKFMRRYAEIPSWWYYSIGIFMFILGVIAVEVYHTGMPIWAMIVANAIPVLYFLPSGFIYAMTGTTIGTNLVGEMVAGYAMPGQPIPNMIFKSYAFMTLAGGLNFVQDLKLGHYMKVPPRQSFAAQVIFTVWLSLVQIGVQQFMVAHVNGLCDPDQPHHWTCPHERVFFTSSIVWGIIGPARLFGGGGLYTGFYWALLIGLFLPLPFWLLARKYPKSWLKFVSVPIVLSCTTFIPPASGIVYTSWFAVAFVFQYLIRRYNFRWWSKYNFVTSAALDSGTIIATIVIFLVLQLPKDGSIALNWWGNTVSLNTLDGNPTSWKVPPPEGFGPKVVST